MSCRTVYIIYRQSSKRPGCHSASRRPAIAGFRTLRHEECSLPAMACIRIGSRDGGTSRGAARSTPTVSPRRTSSTYAATKLPNDRDQRVLLFPAAALQLAGAGTRRRPPTSSSAVKGGRFITHMRKLREIEKPLANFFASGVLALAREARARSYGSSRRPFATTADRFERFFELLPQDTVSRVSPGSQA